MISTIVEPQVACTCRSSTLVILADSGLFHGLLITVTWAINHRFESPECSTIDEPQVVFTCRSSTLAVLDDSGLFHGLLITVTWAIRSEEHTSELQSRLH